MEFVNVTLSGDEENYIIPFGDVHIGDPCFSEAIFDEIIEKAKMDNVYLLLVGDLINNALKNSKSDVYKDTLEPMEQVKTIIKKLMPVRDKIIGLVAGNHEDRTSKECGIDLSELIAEKLEIPYSNSTMYLQIKSGKYGTGFNNYTIFCAHGNGGGGTKGSKANKLHSLSNLAVADIYCMGHIHDSIVFSDPIYLPDTRHNKVSMKKRYYMSSGSCLTYGGYGEKLLLRPGSSTYPIIKLGNTVNILY